MNLQLPLKSPEGAKIVAVCGLQAVYVGINGVEPDGIDPDLNNVTPAASPTPVQTPEGLLFVDDGGEFWTWVEIQTGERRDGPHHLVAQINRSHRANLN
jgi:hypothetical protein